MKRLLSLFFVVTLSVQFGTFSADLPDDSDDFLKSLIDFDALEQDMVASGLDEMGEVVPPSKIVVLLRKLVDPLMVKFIIACDYTRLKWQTFIIAVKQRLTFLSTEKNETADRKA